MKKGILFLAMCLLTANSLPGATIAGTANLLSQSGADQLETWLGEGPITLTRIFAAGGDEDSSDFHAAADNQGRTFTLISARSTGSTDPYSLIGGYNPQSWHSGDAQNQVSVYNTTDVNDRNAFVFRLSGTAVRQMQRLDEAGKYQTYNGVLNGPTFGFGHDIYVDSTLGVGYVQPYSYGDGDDSDNIMGGYDFQNVEIHSIEVFTIAASEVPEPGTMVLLSFGITGLGVLRRRVL